MKAGETLKDDPSGLEVTSLGKTKRVFRDFFGNWINRIDRSSYFKISLDGKTFFVKKATATTNPGVHEFNSSVKAREALKDLSNVEVVEAQLGYSDKNQSWFVSKWADLENKGLFPYDVIVGSVPNDYGTPISQEVLYKEHRNPTYSETKNSIAQIKSKLDSAGLEIHDIDANLFLDPNTRKFFLLDVTVPASRDKTLKQDYWNQPDIKDEI